MMASPRVTRASFGLVKITILTRLKYVTHTYSPDLVDLTQYAGVIYFKQLESFAGGAYAFTYSKYVDTIVIHTHPCRVF